MNINKYRRLKNIVADEIIQLIISCQYLIKALIIKKVYFIFSHCGLGSPLFIPLGGVRGKGREKRKNEMHPIKIKTTKSSL